MMRNLVIGGVLGITLLAAFATEPPDALAQGKEIKKTDVPCVLKCRYLHKDEITACAKAKCNTKCAPDKVKDKAGNAECKSCTDACIEPYKAERDKCLQKCTNHD